MRCPSILPSYGHPSSRASRDLPVPSWEAARRPPVTVEQVMDAYRESFAALWSRRAQLSGYIDWSLEIAERRIARPGTELGNSVSLAKPNHRVSFAALTRNRITELASPDHGGLQLASRILSHNRTPSRPGCFIQKSRSRRSRSRFSRGKSRSGRPGTRFFSATDLPEGQERQFHEKKSFPAARNDVFPRKRPSGRPGTRFPPKNPIPEPPQGHFRQELPLQSLFLAITSPLLLLRRSK